MRRFSTGSQFLFLVLCAMNAVGLSAQSTKELSSSAGEMIGVAAPPWSVQAWANSPSLDVHQMRGKVIVLRFLNDSPTGAASLAELDRAYRAQGLAVVGLYAPQPMPTEVDREQVARLASALGLSFPVGVDSRWETLNRYWLNRADAETGAATFVIDRRGVIRYIQPDGLYERNSSNRVLRREYERLEKQVQELLKEETKQTGEAAAPGVGKNFQPRGKL